MSANPMRLVFGVIVTVARTMGLILIAVAILGLSQLRFLPGRLATSFGLVGERRDPNRGAKN